MFRELIFVSLMCLIYHVIEYKFPESTSVQIFFLNVIPTIHDTVYVQLLISSTKS